MIRELTRDSAISSVRVLVGARHWELKVFNRGGMAGSLCVAAADGPTVLDRLAPRADSTSWLATEQGRRLITPRDGALHGMFC